MKTFMVLCLMLCMIGGCAISAGEMGVGAAVEGYDGIGRKLITQFTHHHP